MFPGLYHRIDQSMYFDFVAYAMCIEILCPVPMI